jgi:hypothetical protein
MKEIEKVKHMHQHIPLTVIHLYTILIKTEKPNAKGRIENIVPESILNQIQHAEYNESL